VLRGLVLPGQRRPHMKDESESRKRSIATAITVSGVTATIYDAGRRYRDERERRTACLHALVLDAARRGDAMLVLEQDDTLLNWDNQRLIEFTRAAGCRDTLRHEHRRQAAPSVEHRRWRRHPTDAPEAPEPGTRFVPLLRGPW
jgi:hypothetical protein